MNTPPHPGDSKDAAETAGAAPETIESSPRASSSAQPAADWICVAAARNVLVVDDNADAAEMLALFLGGSGHEVRTAADGPQALSLLETFPADVTILDIGLPVMDGYELARRISERKAPGAPVLIAVTGYGQVEDAERSRAAGIAHHLVKPVDTDELLRLISTMTGNETA